MSQFCSLITKSKSMAKNGTPLFFYLYIINALHGKNEFSLVSSYVIKLDACIYILINLKCSLFIVVRRILNDRIMF